MLNKIFSPWPSFTQEEADKVSDSDDSSNAFWWFMGGGGIAILWYTLWQRGGKESL